jgi:hypothetical protein
LSKSVIFISFISLLFIVIIYHVCGIGATTFRFLRRIIVRRCKKNNSGFIAILFKFTITLNLSKQRLKKISCFNFN